MKGLSIDEIVNTQILNNSKATSPKNETHLSGVTPDKSVQDGGMFSGNNSPNNRDSRNNGSNLSMGMTNR